MSEPIKVSVNGEIKTVGRIKDNLLAIFPRKKSKHFFRKFNGWGISKSILKRLSRDNIKYIGIKEQEENQNFLITLQKFIDNGHPYTHCNDPQLITNVNKFKIKNK